LPPRLRDNGRTAAAGALVYGGFTSQSRAQPRLAPDASVFAGTLDSYVYGFQRVDPLSTGQHAFHPTRGPTLRTGELCSGNLALTIGLA
jgi:hypothetical protein